MSIIKELTAVKEQYQRASENKWVLPCFCTENLTTTEAILKSAQDFGIKNNVKNVPIMLAITCNYDHRSQAANYTNTRDTATGLKLFTNAIKILADQSGPFSDVDVMIHLDHIQYDDDLALLNGDLSDYASIMYDASKLPFEQNIKHTADFVAKRGDEILIEGACDEIVDATGQIRNALTTPEHALKYKQQTGADLIVANLGTEHRAVDKNLSYHSDVAKQIKQQIGEKIVLHGTSSVSNDQVKNLFDDGVCKVNIWTALEREASPILFEEMVKNAQKVAGNSMVEKLIYEGFLSDQVESKEGINIDYFTTKYRQEIVFKSMVKDLSDYLALWYTI